MERVEEEMESSSIGSDVSVLFWVKRHRLCARWLTQDSLHQNWRAPLPGGLFFRGFAFLVDASA